MATSVFFETQNTNNFAHFPAKEVEMQDEAMACLEKVETYRDISVVKALNKAKFPVYLVNSNINKVNYAMKVFAFSGEKAHPYFQNEARFSFLNHHNIIRTHHVEHERETISKGTIRKVSYTVMEYAPYGDFFDFIMNYNQIFDDMLIRTYFRQLIDGIEYLHNHGVYHMDLKLENLLMGDNFTLKIADFDLSYIVNDPKILSRGTKFYRPPELIQGRCKNTQAADIYSAGIILFTLKTRGMLPHAEDSKVGGVDFAGLLYTHNDEFWNKHCELQKREATFFDQDFKDLFNAMIRLNPNDRATIKQIKACNWYNGPVYTAEEIYALVSQVIKH